jgi:hypothetical protein
VFDTIAATALTRPRVVVILDCCFAGLACEEKEKADLRAHLLMSVGPGRLAEHDPDSTGPTYFTGALVELMRHGDPAAGPWIDLETAYHWLGPRLVASHGEDRQPCQRLSSGKGANCGAIVLGRNAAYAEVT